MASPVFTLNVEGVNTNPPAPCSTVAPLCGWFAGGLELLLQAAPTIANTVTAPISVLAPRRPRIVRPSLGQLTRRRRRDPVPSRSTNEGAPRPSGPLPRLPAAAELHGPRPGRPVARMLEPDQATFLAARQEHRQPPMLGSRPQIPTAPRVEIDQRHRVVPRPLERFGPGLLARQPAEPDVAGGAMEDDRLTRSGPRLAEEPPALPVLRGL